MNKKLKLESKKGITMAILILMILILVTITLITFETLTRNNDANIIDKTIAVKRKNIKSIIIENVKKYEQFESLDEEEAKNYEKKASNEINIGFPDLTEDEKDIIMYAKKIDMFEKVDVYKENNEIFLNIAGEKLTLKEFESILETENLFQLN